MIDVWLEGCLHVDGVPFAESSDVAKSIEIVTFTNRSCNPCHQKSRAFSLFVAILGTGKETKEGKNSTAILQAITKQMTVTGKIGVYVKKDDQWYHLRWSILGLVCDSAAIAKLSNRGAPSSDRPCPLCPIEKEFGVPFLGMDFSRVWGPAIRSKFFKYLPSSHHFTHFLSSTRHRYSGEVRVSNLDQQSPTAGSYVVWDSIPIPTRVRDYLVFSWMHGILKPQNLNVLVDNRASLSVLTLSNVNVEKCNCIPKESSVSNSNEFHIPAPISVQFSIDVMHVLKNNFNNICKLLNNAWSSKDEIDKEYKNTLDWKYPDDQFNGLDGFSIPPIVNSLAMFRLEKIEHVGDNTWINRLMVVPNILETEKCERTIVFYLCLFNYMYQDSMDNPVVNLLSRIINIIGDLYCINCDYNRAAYLQALLSSYLGQLETIVPPKWRSGANHLPNHLYYVLLYYGPLHQINNFLTERQYSEVKRNNTRCRYVLTAVRNRENWKTLCEILSYPSIKSNISVKVWGKPITTNMENIFIKLNLIDDYLLSTNTLQIRRTYVDDCMEGNDICFQRYDQYTKRIEYKAPKYMYKKIRFANTVYKAFEGEISSIQSLEDLGKHSSNICCVRGMKGEMYYFLVEGFVIAKFNGLDYPLAICHPIHTGSMSDECYTQHYCKVLDKWGEYLKRSILISLRRIKMGVIPLWFHNQTILSLSMMKLYHPQIVELVGDELIDSVRSTLC